jgi:restriction system protein
MAIPDYQSIMLPLLKYFSDKKEHSIREIIDALSEKFGLTTEEKKKLLPSGRQTVFYNRVGWAKTYLTKAGLLKSSRRSYCEITQRGLEVLAENISKIDATYLERFPEYLEFRDISKKKEANSKILESEEKAQKTPEEIIEDVYQELTRDLAQNLVIEIMNCSPDYFEQLVVDLLLKMGYGGSRKDVGDAIGKSGDEGIDGIIKEDRLGLDIIYIQAKRWKNPVGRPEIQKFAGALLGQRAKKGVFLTTSTFTEEAKKYVASIDSKIVLVDGEQLGRLMIDHNIGVSTDIAYEIKKIDSDYFEE